MTRASYLKFLCVAINKHNEADHRFNRKENFARPDSLQVPRRYLSRLVVKKGLEYIALKMEEVAMVFLENSIVYVVDSKGRKYFAEKTISEMEAVLDPVIFFRMNRQHLVNVNFIKAFRTYEKVKLMVDLQLPGLEKEIVISQENAASFRQWIHQA